MNMCECSDFLHITGDGTGRTHSRSLCFQQMLMYEWSYNTLGRESYFTKICSVWINSLFSVWGFMHFSYHCKLTEINFWQICTGQDSTHWMVFRHINFPLMSIRIFKWAMNTQAKNQSYHFKILINYKNIYIFIINNFESNIVQNKRQL